jgi:hypothetical protein
MIFPSRHPKREEDKRALADFYDTFAKAQWFIKAEFVENHPTQMRNVIEAHVAYIPTLEMKDVLTWLHKFNLGIDWKVVESAVTDKPGR